MIDLYSVKPVDAEALLAAVRGAVAEAGVSVRHLAVPEIPHSGPPRTLLERYGIGRGAIVTAARELADAEAGAPTAAMNSPTRGSA